MLPEYLGPGLTVVFVGTSVSRMSAERGHYYSNPTNKFWALLAATGLLGDDRLSPQEDARILDYGVGLSDLVNARAESSDARLGLSDFDARGLVAKIETFQPRVVAFNGRKAVDVVARHLGEPVPAVGPASWVIAGARVYRLPSSSGSASIGTQVKRKAWEDFGRWIRDYAS